MPRKPKSLPDIVGLSEIADRLEVQVETAYRWRTRRLLPDPTWMLSGAPVWLWEVIEQWATLTGRLPEQKQAKGA